MFKKQDPAGHLENLSSFGQDQVQAQPGFQAKPGVQQVHFLCGY